MCGRFTLTLDPDVVQLAFDLSSVPQAAVPRYNIAPTQPVLALTNEGTRDASLLRWGLIPSWAKDPAIGNKLINARAETLAEKPSFRTAYRKRRCVIFADGFYEWQRAGGDKVPLYIRLHDGAPFVLAGLWEVWREPESDEWVRTCTIVTTAANEFMKPIHNRMPVILPREALDTWLAPQDMDPAALQGLLVPWQDEAVMGAYEVSKAVNNPRNDLPRCIEPVQ
ncbi:MAG: SOS response-associated peptidase [Anaerolineae bacterium]|nr:SOS response-associated peptidase [Anaerolineae bacterium]